jgi:hypothetical protein
MSTRHSIVMAVVVAGTSLALVAPVLAQEAAPAQKLPLKLTAFAVSMQAGISGVLDITIDRWSTDAEREMLIKTFVEGGQDKLLNALQDIRPRTGYLRTPNSLGYDIKYARENILPDGTRQIVIVNDRRIGFAEARNQTRTMDYPFTLIELRFPKGKNEGEGKWLVSTKLSIENKRLEIENYGQEPVRLTTVKELK